MCIVKDEEEDEKVETETVKEKDNLEITNPHISMNALDQGVPGCLKVTGRVDKLPIFIMIDSGSTHNFLNTWVANKLQCALTPINPVTVKAINGGKCYALQSIRILGGKYKEYTQWLMCL